MPTVDKVADYFIWRAHEVGDPISNLKLQKLVYYAQAWHLALHGAGLFEGDFEAWVHGPIHRGLYERFSSYRWKPIDEDVEQPDLAPEILEHLEEVWEVYGGFSPWDLERLTHRERPWRETRDGLAPDENCEDVIDPAIMAEFYGNLAQNLESEGE